MRRAEIAIRKAIAILRGDRGKLSVWLFSGVLWVCFPHIPCYLIVSKIVSKFEKRGGHRV